MPPITVLGGGAGPGGGGGSGGGGSGADGDPLFIPPIPTVEALGAILRQAVKSLELPRALSRGAELQKRSSDAEANHIAQQGLSIATAAYNDERNMLNAIYAVASYAQSIVDNPPSSVHWGITTFTFSGSGAGEFDTETVTGESWVVDYATTPVFVITNQSPRTSDVQAYNFNCSTSNYVTGVGFDITLVTSGTVLAASDYDAIWFAFG